MTEAKRAWIYRVTTALGLVATTFGLITESKVAAILGVVTALTNGLATANTSTKG